MSTNRPALPAEIVDALRQGRLIEAIKLLRQQQGLGLKEAKELIDLARGQLAARSLASESMQAAPPSPPHPAASSPTHPSSLLDGYAPGEVPRQSNAASWALVLAAALLCWYLLR